MDGCFVGLKMNYAWNIVVSNELRRRRQMIQMKRNFSSCGAISSSDINLTTLSISYHFHLDISPSNNSSSRWRKLFVNEFQRTGQPPSSMVMTIYLSRQHYEKNWWRWKKKFQFSSKLVERWKSPCNGHDFLFRNGRYVYWKRWK